jgi:hypothetical protein
MLPVNTLRDNERAAATRANMALLLMTAVLGYAGTFDDCLSIIVHDSSEDSDENCTFSEQFLLVKLLLIAALMYGTFNSYNQEIRFLGHAQVVTTS